MSPSIKAKIHSVAKIAMVVDLLADEGIAAEEALADVSLSRQQLESPATKVSAAQLLQSYRNAIKLSRNAQFAYLVGSKACVSTYGIFGFATLSCPTFREMASFALAYHQLATPLVQVGFREERDVAAWIVAPLPYLELDQPLCEFMVKLHMAVFLSLHRKVIGPTFKPALLDYAVGRPTDDSGETAFFDCPVFYGKPENRFVFDVAWLDRQPNFGNEFAHAELKQLCDGLLKEFELSAGVAGEVRELVLSNLSRQMSFEQVAKGLNMSGRSLRRRLQEEGTCFRQLVDELRGHIAIKYIRDTDLSVEDIAFTLGFGDASSFRYAFRRWTNAAPHEYRKGAVATKHRTLDSPGR